MSMSILQQKQQEQGAGQIVLKTQELLAQVGMMPVTIAWDLGQLNPQLDEHTLNVLVENGIVKESFTSRELEECYSFLRPVVEEKLRKMIERLLAQVRESG
jgi:hypothetical protein